MGKLLPLILIVLGIGGGAGAGFLLKPAPHPALENPCGEDPQAASSHPEAQEIPPEDREYVKLNNQFVVPVVGAGRVEALVVLSLSLEVALGSRETAFTREPKLRDVFLQELFDYANQGGFKGVFTQSNTLDVLRTMLLEAGQQVMGETLLDVLITEIARQDA